MKDNTCDKPACQTSLQELRARLDGHDERLTDGDTRFCQLETALAENTSITKEIKDILESAKGAFRALNWLGKLAAALTPLLAFGAALYAALGGKK